MGHRRRAATAGVPITFTAPALADLVWIRTYIGQDNPAAANRIAVQLTAACDRLEYLPERGRPGQVPGTRELATIRPHVIVYRVVPGGVEILRVWHGAQGRRP